MLAQILSYLDLTDLIHLARTSPALNATLLAPSAQSIWSRSRRNAGYVLFPGMSEIKFALMMEGSLCQASSPRHPLQSFLPRPNNGMYAVLRRQGRSRGDVAGAFVRRLQGAAVGFSYAQQTLSDHADTHSLQSGTSEPAQ